MLKYTNPPLQGNNHLPHRIRWLSRRYHLTLPIAGVIAECAFAVTEVR
ncbi:MAG: hypothetical protein AB7V46_09935 [Thermomicrobiales bacterium]